jgi:hypothetical protein
LEVGHALTLTTLDQACSSRVSAASRSSNNHVVVVAVEVHSSSLHSIYQDQDLDLSFMLSCSRRGSSLEIIDNMIPLELVKCGMCGKVSTIS